MKKVVLKVALHDDKAKQKAMKAVSSLSGVDSVAVDMKAKKMTVIGDFDPLEVVCKLRKVLRHAAIDTVGPAKETKKEKEDKGYPYSPYMPLYYHVPSAHDEGHPNSCAIF